MPSRARASQVGCCLRHDHSVRHMSVDSYRRWDLVGLSRTVGHAGPTRRSWRSSWSAGVCPGGGGYWIRTSEAYATVYRPPGQASQDSLLPVETWPADVVDVDSVCDTSVAGGPWCLTALACPVHPVQSGNAAELRGVRRHDAQPTPKRLSGCQQVVSADRGAVVL